MINANLLKEIITEQRGLFSNTVGSIDRDILHTENFSKICRLKEAVIVTGIRRSGKSYLLRLVWEKIKKEEKAVENNLLYFNFEDEKLLRFRADDFDLMMESYFELFDVRRDKKVYLFFDEIQNIPGWEKFINRLLEKDEYKIFITGSNATLLSKEISSSLTGRNYSIIVYPLSFREFARYKLGRELKSAEMHEQKSRIAVKKVFKEYVDNGGFPEIAINNFRPLLQEYLKNIIYRDIVLRYKIKNEANLREISAFIISNIGTILSLEKIRKMTKVRNLMTIKNYLSHLEDSFLFFLVPKHSYSIKKQIYNPDKIYVIDTGMYNEVAFLNSPNDGRLLENLVFLELRRLNRGVYYFEDKKECDFVIQEKNKIKQAIQVSKLLSVENKEREIAGLVEAMEKYSLEEGLILTEDGEDDIKVGDKKILVRPIYKWLLFGLEK